jgi:thiol-disulfide isomerase/thioredoxin
MPVIFKRKGAWALLVSFLVLVVAVQTAYRGLSKQQQANISMLGEGDVLPRELPLLALDGTASQVGDLGEKALLINFWAGWCGPCLKEMPSLYKLQDLRKERGLVVLAVAMDESPEGAKKALQRFGGAPPFTVYQGFERPIFSRFPVEGIPFTVLVDKKGVIRYAKAGERDWTDAESLALVEEIL